MFSMLKDFIYCTLRIPNANLIDASKDLDKIDVFHSESKLLFWYYGLLCRQLLCVWASFVIIHIGDLVVCGGGECQCFCTRVFLHKSFHVCSVSNLLMVSLLFLDVNVYSILLRHNLVLSLDAVKQLEERLVEDDRILQNQFE